jgi:hypothetical protein
MTRMALTALIDDTIERNDWRSDTRVVQQAADRGHKLNKAEVSSYRLRGMKQIVPEKVIALAAGLQVPPYRVALAVLADAGIDVPLDVRSPELAIEHDPTLSVAARRHVLAIIEADRAGR